MWACRSARKLIAAAAYCDITPRERARLDKHLEQCAECRAEAQATQEFVAVVPKTRPELNHDLVPGVRARLVEEAGRQGARRWRFAVAGAVCALALFVVIYGASTRGPQEKATEPVLATNPSPVQQALGQAQQLTQEHEYAAAYLALANTLKTRPEDAAAGQAQVVLADLLFSKLHLYKEAYKAYEALLRLHPDAYEASPDRAELASRYNLLREAKSTDFESLYALDAARDFTDLEHVVARYPATYVASHAADRMALMVAAESGFNQPEGYLTALEQARDECTHPIAVAQLKWEMGLVCWKQLHEPGLARDLFEQVKTSDNTALAELASNALLDMRP